MITDIQRQISDYEAKFHALGTRSDIDSAAERKVLLSRIDELKRMPANRPATLQDFGSSSRSASGPFGSFGEMLRSVAIAGTPGGQIDSRLYEARAATGLGETTPSDGGFLVGEDYSNELLTAVYQTGILAQRCRRIQISGNSNSIKINAFDESSRASTRFGGIVSYFRDEAGQYTASKPKFRQIELNLKKMIGLAYASDEVLADSAVLESVIKSAFISEFGFQMDNMILNGTGAGQPLGILNSGCLVSVAKETGQKAATVVFENVVKMYSRQLNHDGAVWLVHPNIMPALYSMSLSVGTGGVPVYMPAGGLNQGPYSMLFGKPVIPVEQCQTLGALGDIIYANLGSYVIAEKGGIETATSIHVQFLYGEQIFRFTMRWDGMPERASALTPFTGSDTLSPFVALAARA